MPDLGFSKACGVLMCGDDKKRSRFANNSANMDDVRVGQPKNSNGYLLQNCIHFEEPVPYSGNHGLIHSLFTRCRLLVAFMHAS